MARKPTPEEIRAALGLPDPRASKSYSFDPINAGAMFPDVQAQPWQGTGSIKATPRTIATMITDDVSRELEKAGVEPRRARRFSNRLFKALNELTPVGDAALAAEAAADVSQGHLLSGAVKGGLASIGWVPGTGDALAMGGKALLHALPSTEAMFLGPLAKNANLKMLAKAKEMTKAGYNADYIWNQTGWFKQHGDWKFEISDRALRLNLANLPNWGAGERGAVPLSKVVSHPKLQQAYPDEWAKVSIARETNPNPHLRGQYDPTTHLLTTRGGPDARETMAHELQHFVEEGPEQFPRGGILTGYDPAGLRPPQQAYWEVAGEVEARNTARRLSGSSAQRKSLPPWYTQDVPDYAQIALHPGEAGVLGPSPNLNLSNSAKAAARKLATMAGSPAGARKKLTEKQVIKLSEDYLKHVKRGVEGADWYQKSGRSVMKHLGENEPAAVKFTGAMGVTSANTGIDPNLEHAVRGYEQRLAGAPIKTGKFPNQMGRDVERVFDAPDMTIQQLRDLGDAAPFGRKRTPFMQQILMNEGANGRQSSARAVHDIWDIRARGYGGKNGKAFMGTPGQSIHNWTDLQDQAYLIPEANRRAIGGRTDWDTGSLQAAAWTGHRIDDLMKKGKTLKEARRIAAADYSNAWDRIYAHYSWESAPGSNTGHMVGFDDLPWAAKKRYHDEVRKAFLNPEGQSKISLALGMPTGKSFDAGGYFEGQVNPGTVDQIAIARAIGSQEIDPSSAKMMDAIAATQGLLGAQKGAAWNFESPAKSTWKDANSFMYDIGRPLGREDIERLGGLIDRTYPAGNVGLLGDDKGLIVGKFWDETNDVPLADFAKGLSKGQGLPKATPTTMSSHYIENRWDTPEEALGQGYILGYNDERGNWPGLKNLGVPGYGAKVDTVAPDIARQMVDRIDPAMMKRAGFTGSGSIELLRKTWANEGWDGVVKLVESQKGSVEAKTALLAALAGLAVAGVGSAATSEAQP